MAAQVGPRLRYRPCRCRAQAPREEDPQPRPRHTSWRVEESAAVWKRKTRVWTSLDSVNDRDQGEGGEGGIGTLLRSLFLPSGYPDAVRQDFQGWLAWHLASLFNRDVLQVLSSQALLVAVSRSSATASSVVDSLGLTVEVAAATQWVLKDAPGSLATLAVGSRGGQNFDEDPKRWWVVTSAVEDAARLVEVLLPLHPGWFLPGAALANVLRSGALVGRQSLVNGTILRHFALRENLGDIRAKLEAQGRILAIAALPVGIGLFRWTQGLATVSNASGNEAVSPAGLALASAVYGTLFLSKNYFCYRAAKALRFENLNANRLVLAARSYVKTGEAPTPSEVADLEGVYAPRGRQLDRVRFGASFEGLREAAGSALDDLIEAHEGEGYLLAARGRGREAGVLVCVKGGCTDEDVAKAALQGEILAARREAGGEGGALIESRCLEEASSALGDFLARLEAAGWSLRVVRGAWNTVEVTKLL